MHEIMGSILNLYAGTLQIGHCHLGILAFELRRKKFLISKQA